MVRRWVIHYHQQPTKRALGGAGPITRPGGDIDADVWQSQCPLGATITPLWVGLGDRHLQP